MRIRCQPLFGAQEVELRDITGGSPFAKWMAGEEREIPAGTTVAYMMLGGKTVQLDTATAIFRHGLDFVDADTGKNPLFSCKRCGEAANDMFIVLWKAAGPEKIDFIDENGARLCIGDYLADHPDLIVPFRARGVAQEHLAKAQSILSQRSQPTTKVAAPVTQEPEE